MPLRTILRTFLLTDAILTTASIVISLALSGQDGGAESRLYLVISGILLLAWLAALIGLWRCRDWARVVYLVVAGIGVVGTLLVGGGAASGLEDALSSVCWLVTGVIIALVYWSPLAVNFRSDVRAA